MTSGIFIRSFMIILGVYLIIMTLLSLAKRKMTEQFCLVWSVLSVLLIILGILINPSQIERYVRGRVLAVFLLAVLGVVWGVWFISIQVSILIRKNQELAMQTSLLNYDNEEILKQLKVMQEELEILKKNMKTEENSR